MGPSDLNSSEMRIVSSHLKMARWILFDDKALDKLERFIQSETGQDFGGNQDIKDQLGFPRMRNYSSDRDWDDWFKRYGRIVRKGDNG